MYPKPGPVGGTLIRQTIGTIRSARVPLPIAKSRVVVALSAGSDSMALAVLLARYGRRIVDKSKLCFAHVNHHWRGVESDADEEYVRTIAANLDVPLEVFHLKPQTRERLGKCSPEELARRERMDCLEQGEGWILTAH